ncbi:MAG: hypothetical protein D6786_02630 [Gammaproteobacteria bacterium]|nr:MAG: hypothetical protein D6786_02630 [Gammaproteobacteria bacterium]
MSDYEIVPDGFLGVTPAGAYYAVSDDREEPARELLRALLEEARTPPCTPEELARLSGIPDLDSIGELVWRMEEAGWLRGLEQPRAAPDCDMEGSVPRLLAALSDHGQACLADTAGFYLARAGFPHEAAEELAALSADLGSLHDRHRGLLQNNLRLPGSAWGLIDAAGHSRLGIWPLFIGGHRFSLVIEGPPRFAQPAFSDFVWSLCNRYR